MLKMNKSIMRHPISILLSTLMSFPAFAGDSSSGLEGFPGEVRTRIQMDASTIATEWLATLQTLATPEEKQVPLTKLIRKLMPYGFAKVGGLSARDVENPPDRWVLRRRENDAKYDRRFIKALQPHSADFLTHQSFAKAIESLLAVWPRKLLLLDSDGDGRIALAEYALGSPLVQNQETDEDGFAEHQRRGFAFYDQNKNGSIDGTEMVRSTSYVHKKMRQYMSALLISRADVDGDSSLSQSELRQIVPESKDLPKSVPLSEAIFWIRLVDTDGIAPLRDTLLGKK